MDCRVNPGKDAAELSSNTSNRHFGSERIALKPASASDSLAAPGSVLA